MASKVVVAGAVRAGGKSAGGEREVFRGWPGGCQFFEEIGGIPQSDGTLMTRSDGHLVKIRTHIVVFNTPSHPNRSHEPPHGLAAEETLLEWPRWAAPSGGYKMVLRVHRNLVLPVQRLNLAHRRHTAEEVDCRASSAARSITASQGGVVIHHRAGGATIGHPPWVGASRQRGYSSAFSSATRMWTTCLWLRHNLPRPRRAYWGGWALTVTGVDEEVGEGEGVAIATSMLATDTASFHSNESLNTFGA